MTYIAYNHNSEIVSIVEAKSEELAKVYWQGAGIDWNTSKCIQEPKDFTPLSEHPTGVFPILKTQLVDSWQFREYKLGSKILTIKK